MFITTKPKPMRLLEKGSTKIFSCGLPPSHGTSVFIHHRKRNKRFWVLSSFFIGFPRVDNWGTLRIPREDWGTLGKIRGITTPPLRILLFVLRRHKQIGWRRTFKSIRRNLRDPDTTKLGWDGFYSRNWVGVWGAVMHAPENKHGYQKFMVFRDEFPFPQRGSFSAAVQQPLVLG